MKRCQIAILASLLMLGALVPVAKVNADEKHFQSAIGPIGDRPVSKTLTPRNLQNAISDVPTGTCYLNGIWDGMLLDAVSDLSLTCGETEDVKVVNVTFSGRNVAVVRTKYIGYSYVVPYVEGDGELNVTVEWDYSGYSDYTYFSYAFTTGPSQSIWLSWNLDNWSPAAVNAPIGGHASLIVGDLEIGTRLPYVQFDLNMFNEDSYESLDFHTDAGDDGLARFALNPKVIIGSSNVCMTNTDSIRTFDGYYDQDFNWTDSCAVMMAKAVGKTNLAVWRSKKGVVSFKALGHSSTHVNTRSSYATGKSCSFNVERKVGKKWKVVKKRAYPDDVSGFGYLYGDYLTGNIKSTKKVSLRIRYAACSYSETVWKQKRVKSKKMWVCYGYYYTACAWEKVPQYKWYKKKIKHKLKQLIGKVRTI